MCVCEVLPVGVGVVGDDVVAAGDQALVHAGQVGVGLGGAQDALFPVQQP